MNPSFSVIKIRSSEIAIARGLSRFSAKIFTDALSEFDVGTGNGIGSDGEVKTKTENITTTITAMI